MKHYHAPMHTAEHILNQTMVRFFDCERSFTNHLEKKKSKCDYHFSRPLTQEEEQKIEDQVNRVIYTGWDVVEEYLNMETASEQFDLSGIPGLNNQQVRLIKIGDYDVCPCIGHHVTNTLEIGTFKITTTSYKNGVLRIRFKLLDRNTSH